MNYNIKEKTPVKSADRRDYTPDRSALTLKPAITPIKAENSQALASAFSRINNSIAQINERNFRTNMPVTPMTPNNTPVVSAVTPVVSAVTPTISAVAPVESVTESVIMEPQPADIGANINSNLVEKMNATSLALKFHIRVDRIMWEEIPIGSHICYFTTAGEFISARIIKRIFRKDDSADMYFGLQSAAEKKRKTEVVAFSDVEKIWKKYPEDSIVEFLLIHNSLRMKNAQIAALEAKVNELSALVHSR